MGAPLRASFPKRSQEPLSCRAIECEVVDDEPISQMEDAIAGGEQELEIMRDGKYDAFGSSELFDCRGDFLHVLPVQAARRLIEEIDGALVDESACYREALLLPP